MPSAPPPDPDLEAEVEFLGKFASDYGSWTMGQLSAEWDLQRLNAGEAVSPEAIDRVRKLKQSLMASSDRVHSILTKRGVYHPIIHIRSNGQEEQYDVMANLFNADLKADVFSFLNGATDQLRKKLPATSFPTIDLAKLKEDAAAHAKRAAAQRKESEDAMKAFADAVANSTPEEREPLAAQARGEAQALGRRLDAIETSLANQRKWWRRMIEPVIGLIGFGTIGGALSYYLHSEIRETVTNEATIKLIDAQLKALDEKKPAELAPGNPPQQSQAQPSLPPPPSAPTPSAAPSTTAQP